MTTKIKSFDCVGMKNRIQSEMMSEYENQKEKFPSFVAFVKSKTAQSEWVQRVKAKIKKVKQLPPSKPQIPGKYALKPSQK